MAEFLRWIGDRGIDKGGYANGVCSIPIGEFPLSSQISASVPECMSHMAVDLAMWGRTPENMNFDEQVTPKSAPGGVVLSMSDFSRELEEGAAELGWSDKVAIPAADAWETKEEAFEAIGDKDSPIFVHTTLEVPRGYNQLRVVMSIVERRDVPRRKRNSSGVGDAFLPYGVPKGDPALISLGREVSNTLFERAKAAGDNTPDIFAAPQLVGIFRAHRIPLD